MARTLSLALASLMAVGLVTAQAAGAEPKAWDQAAVTALAKELAAAAGDVRQSVRQSPQGTSAGRASRNRHQALDDLRVIENSINHLARRLEAGEGREDTRPTYQRIVTLRNDIAMRARRALILEPTLTKLETARGLLEQLSPYYEDAPEAG